MGGTKPAFQDDTVGPEDSITARQTDIAAPGRTRPARGLLDTGAADRPGASRRRRRA